MSAHPLLRDDADAFSAGSWHKSSASCLLRATEAVDVCCHAIVSTNSRFHNSSSVSVESRRLALTVAVFERSLYAYALRISAAARQANMQQQQQQQQQQAQPTGPSSNVSSANSTPTLTAANQSSATAASQSQPSSTPLPPLPPLPHAPFLPQLPYFAQPALHTHAESDEWPQQPSQPPPPPLSYTSTIPSSSAHSLAASAIASNQRMQQHTQQQQTRFMQQHSAQSQSGAHRPPKLPVTHPALPAAPSSSVASGYSPLPASPIPPTVSAPAGAWPGHRSSSGAMLYMPPTTPTAAAAATAQLQLAAAESTSTAAVSLPNQAGQQSTSQPSRARTFSASPVYNAPSLSQPSAILHAASAASPLSGSLAHSAALLSAIPALPSPRSSSPVDPSNSAVPSSPFPNSYSPLPSHRSLLSAPHSSAATSHSSSHSQSASGSGGGEPLPLSVVWHQPAGMTCLLRILTHQLWETRDVLLALNADCSSFPRYIRHLLAQSVHLPTAAVHSAARHPRGVMVAASGMAFVSLLHNLQPLTALRAILALFARQWHAQLREQLDLAAHSSAAAFLLSFIPPSIQSAVLTIASVLSPRVLLPQLRAALHTRAAFTIIPLALWFVYRLSRYRRISRLKALHSRLGLLLRLWHISFSLLEAGGRTASSNGGSNNGSSSREQRLSDSVDDSSSLLANRERARVPISRWLLELVPPELDASFWYHSTFRLSLVKYGLDVLYCAVNEWYRACACRPVGLPVLLLAALFYACQPHLAASTASRLMAAPDIAMVRHAWALLDTTVARRVVTQLLPALGRSPRLAVLREIELVDADTLQRLSHQRGNGRRKQVSEPTEAEQRYEVRLSPSSQPSKPLRLSDSCIRMSPRKHPRRYQRVGSSRLHESMSSSLDDDADDTQPGSDSTLRLLLLSARPLHLSVNLRFHRVPSVSHLQPVRPTSSAVVLYLHGGGFFADFQASHLHFLAEWSNELGLPIVYVNYSLAPDNAYPTALNECYDAYRWLVEGRLGLNADRIILVGDSTGGNLAAGCCMKAIQDKLRVPDAVILACPILNLRLTPTPSRSLYMMDAVLPMNLLLACRSLYLASPAAASDADIDPCLTGDHRVLTGRGWKSIKAVQVGDVVLSFNTDMYAQQWKPVTAVTSHAVNRTKKVAASRCDCWVPDTKKEDRLYRMQGSGMDVIATSDHRMLVARLDATTADGLQKGRPVGYETVEQLLPSKRSYTNDQSTTNDFKHSPLRAVVRSGLNLQPATKLVIAGLERVCDWWWAKDKQRGFLHFLGFWLGNGHLGTQGGCVCVSQRKANGVWWLERLLDDVFHDYWFKNKSEADARGSTDKYYIRCCPPLYNYLRLMAAGPPGYNPRDPAQLRSYPHFTYEWTLAAREQLSAYGRPSSTSSWTEDEMLAAFSVSDSTPQRRLSVSSTAADVRRASLSFTATSTEDVEQDEDAMDQETQERGESTEHDEENEDDAEHDVDAVASLDLAQSQAMRAAGKSVWWNSGEWSVINGDWFCLKRWLGDETQMADVYSKLSKSQAIALLEGFCRADGSWSHTQYDDDGEPTGVWECSNSSFPLIDQLSLIAQLAGAAVDLELHTKVGKAMQIDGRNVLASVDQWRLRFIFTQSKRPFHADELAEPVDVSGEGNIDKRGYHQYEDDGRVYCVTVADNDNFLTQRLSTKRSSCGTSSVNAHSLFIGNCLSAIVASDSLLRQWPLTSIMVGAYDPFVDDAVDFAHRLAAVGVAVRLKVYDGLPHSFFDFAPMLPQARQALQLAGEWIRQSAEQPQPQTSHSDDDA